VSDGAGADSHRVSLIYQSGETRLSTTAQVARLLAPEEDEAIRWYLEEYRRFPFEPAPVSPGKRRHT